MENKKESTKDRLAALKKAITEPEEIKEAKPKRGKSINKLNEDIQSIKPVIATKNLHFDFKFTPLQMEFLQLYVPYYFNISAICKEMGISRQLYYDWCRDVEGFEKTIEDLNEGMIDKAIEVIYRTMDLLDAKSAQFILKTKGKKRGYGDSIDVTSNGQSISIPTINIILPKQDELES